MQPRRTSGMRVASGVVCTVVLLLLGCGSSDEELPTGQAASSASPTPLGAWTRANPKQDGLQIRGTAEMMAVVAAGPGFVAVGEGNSGAEAWTSRDGIHWNSAQVEQSSSRSTDRAVMMDVTIGGPGLVGVGFEQDSAGSRGAVWTSTDGTAWARVPHQPAFGAAGYQLMSSVALGGPGLVAVGWAEYDHASNQANAAVWTSEDGRVWRRIPNDEDVFAVSGNGGMLDVTSTSERIVAVGSDGPNAAVWTSPDAVTWSRLAHDDVLFGGDQTMSDVAVGGPGFVSVGYDNAGGGGEVEGAVVWASADGMDWTRMRPTQAARASFGAIAVDGSVLVAAGAVNASGLEAAVWTSEDGQHWTSAGNGAIFGGPGTQRINAVGIGGGRAVAVGADHWNGPQPAVWTALRRDNP